MPRCENGIPEYGQFNSRSVDQEITMLQSKAMKKTTVRLDEYVHTLLEHIAEQRGLSLNHLINYALVRFVSFEEATQMLEERTQRARTGAMQRVLRKTAAQATPPLHAEDQRPPGFDRRVLERRISREAELQRTALG